MADHHGGAGPADLLIRGGRVLAPGGGAPTTVAVTGERIAAVGDSGIERTWRGPRTEIVDARGGLVMPGFDDAHLHLRSGAIALEGLDLFGLTGLDHVLAAIAAHATARRDGAWVTGRGWLYAAFPGGMPTRQQLDAVVPDRPAYLRCFDGHSGWANSRALEIAGIDEQTADPPDGRIVRDAEGRPTGALNEGATELVARHVPQPSESDLDRLLRQALAALAGRGVTAVQDALGSPGEWAALARIREADGRLDVRARMAMELPGPGGDGGSEAFERLAPMLRHHAGDPWLRSGILKSFMDGVVEARTAAMLEPYPGGDARGDPRWTDRQIRDAVAEAHRRGWQVELHAIGTAGVRQALDAYEALGPGEAAARRHRIEHIETLDPADLPRFAALGVVASMQPLHALPDVDQLAVWRSNLQPAVADSGWRIRSLLDTGAVLAFGSDWPVVPFDPFLALHAAVTRTASDGRPPRGWLPEEAIGLPEALAAATWGSAYAEHAERVRGSLAVGRLADLVVLDRDLLSEDAAAILGTEVRLTLVGGRVVHRSS